MSKSIDLYLDNETEELIDIVLENSDDFENQSQLIRICVKKHLKQNYPELILKKFENEE